MTKAERAMEHNIKVLDKKYKIKILINSWKNQENSGYRVQFISEGHPTVEQAVETSWDVREAGFNPKTYIRRQHMSENKIGYGRPIWQWSVVISRPDKETAVKEGIRLARVLENSSYMSYVKARRDEVRELRNQGLTISEVISRTGCSLGVASDVWREEKDNG